MEFKEYENRAICDNWAYSKNVDSFYRIRQEEYPFFQVVIIVKLDFMKTKITLRHSSMQINLSTLSIWKHDTHEGNSELQLQANQDEL